jgi:hypothetical protein
VNIDVSASQLDVKAYNDPLLIGSRDLDLQNLASQYSEIIVKNRLEGDKSPGDLRSGELKDGISDAECAELKRKSTLIGTYDFRGVTLTDALLKRVSDCGSPGLLITNTQASELRPRLEHLPALSFDYVRDDSAELAARCRDKLGPQTPSKATESCAATLSGGESLGVGFTTLLSGR